MKLTLAASVLLLGLASPLPTNKRAEPSNTPIHWNGPSSSVSVKCGQNTYNGHDIFLATQRAVNLGLLSPPETRGAERYPQPFDHNDSNGVKLHFPQNCPENDQRRKQFPVVKDGPYDGDKNSTKDGDERVIYYYDGMAEGVDGHPRVVYCGLLTHKGAANGGFLQCPDGR